MPFKIVRNDITKMKTDAIVNTANPFPVAGEGSDTNVYKAAGYEKLLKARQELGNIERGQAVFTEGFNLPARYIIHTVGPEWKDGSYGEEDILRNCYRNSLEVAKELNCKSVSLPLISTGNYHFPKDKALTIALSEINNFLINTDFSNPFDEEDYSDMEVFLVVYDQESFEVSSKLDSDILSYIDQNYIEKNRSNQNLISGIGISCEFEKPHLMAKKLKTSSAAPLFAEEINFERIQKPEAAVETVGRFSLEEILKSKEEPFQDILMRHIAEKNLANKDVYKKANIDAKLFSKIICKKNYVPKKKNVMALAIGLQLNLKEAEAFMSAAGYAFSPSEKFDLIVKFYISKKIYNMYEIEAKLYELTGETLGNLIA